MSTTGIEIHPRKEAFKEGLILQKKMLWYDKLGAYSCWTETEEHRKISKYDA